MHKGRPLDFFEETCTDPKYRRINYTIYCAAAAAQIIIIIIVKCIISLHFVLLISEVAFSVWSHTQSTDERLYSEHQLPNSSTLSVLPLAASTQLCSKRHFIAKTP
jgi:hypothetical protein